MHLADTPRRFGEHQNAFGFLRLLFASLVIASHVPEIIDNDSHREVLHQLTNTVTFGWLAVASFFIISGYLITGSLVSSHSLPTYFVKRIARIYPGFIVASIVCLTVVAPLAGASFKNGTLHTIVASIAHMAILGQPVAEHPFPGSNYSDALSGLNGALWTIQYEFACYVLVALLYLIGLIRIRLITGIAVLLLAIGTWLPSGALPWLSHRQVFTGAPASLFQLTGYFLSGAVWYLCRERVGFTMTRLVACMLGLAFALCHRSTSNFGFASLGGYVIFGIAKLGGGTWLSRINNRTDISYGVYIYAWPVEKLLTLYVGGSLMVIGFGTWFIALACGWLSWTFVEAPALNYAKAILTAMRRKSFSPLG